MFLSFSEIKPCLLVATQEAIQIPSPGKCPVSLLPTLNINLPLEHLQSISTMHWAEAK